MELKNSVLLLVFFNLEFINSIASIDPIGAIMRLKTFIFWRSFLSKRSSSLRVPDLVISIAGNKFFKYYLIHSATSVY